VAIGGSENQSSGSFAFERGGNKVDASAAFATVRQRRSSSRIVPALGLLDILDF
jgi:hypothetical protein